ncbi:hypothetical protein [Rhizobium sp. C4]|uniref:hypothetical protein n=1 Tax=Rhizobium sp. C4 TaxID=1349800 RepID=UPI001E2927BD|nr:hypothetical protein [Rhizobium sp. C4]MCD2174879.1 hypothetical protein [Rhizobium sp. C4]
MDWVPIVLIVFKVAVLAVGMFFSIKWHYDQDKSRKPVNILRVVLEVAVYVLMIVILFSLVYALFRHFHLLPAGLDFF